MKNGNKIRFRQKGNMAPGCLPGDIGEIFIMHFVLLIISAVNPTHSGRSKDKKAQYVPTQELRSAHAEESLTSRSIVRLQFHVCRILKKNL